MNENHQQMNKTSKRHAQNQDRQEKALGTI